MAGQARTGLDPWSKAGIIIKASTRPGSAYAAMMVTGSHGVRMQYDYTADIAGMPGPVSAASPRWLRLTRSGDTVTGYDSADGTAWKLVGTAHLRGLPATVQAGLFAASPGTTVSGSHSLTGSSSGGARSLATGAFDHVSLRARQAGGHLDGQLYRGRRNRLRRTGRVRRLSPGGRRHSASPAPVTSLPS